MGAIVTPGNVHDSHVLHPLVERVSQNVKKALAVAADAVYKTPAIMNFLLENRITIFKNNEREKNDKRNRV
ncbi:hypothetical protein ABD90_20095 [Lysinibacillus fusiformis]|uniref:Transposase IS4-like domain-containing protein n=1 Tax=Lysinibacillus sphaericus CBAM5 TaxID=1400869 RepID=W7RZF8_LYSSH|nr:hypothetical protein AR327_13140 [Lysinibacillus sphaericus]EWH32670.1 hypothetical protein P799_11310 [Lysinibacillus sphaericus CBAM5]MBG9727502.1 hypothetical protein [Lysinibacillus fusiformis]AMR91577.1 hypothetical protein A1T07_16075 [Lysinibacillus sphaericus]ANA45624.1 hypothetical protein A2J09_08735 [Lysinibacillus sphaericus]